MEQVSTGHLQLDGSSPAASSKKDYPLWDSPFLVPLTGLVTFPPLRGRNQDLAPSSRCRQPATGRLDLIIRVRCGQYEKGYPEWDNPFHGAANRTRTGTELLQADFKSAMSTIPSQRRLENMIAYFYDTVKVDSVRQKKENRDKFRKFT